MRAIGDNVHVLGCIEALQDETNLYIIMPYCKQGSLCRLIANRQGLPEDQARLMFRQILENLRYLRYHRICHRDLSPDNCLVYQGRIVFNDLARSFLLPPEASHVHHGTGGHGKPPYQPREVFFDHPYNAYVCDLWAAVVIFFNLLTGHVLYYTPIDRYFEYFIVREGLSSPWNDSAEMVSRDLIEYEMIQEVVEPQPSFVEIKSKCLELSPEALEIFGSVLRMASQERWDLDDVAGSRFMNPPI